MWLLLFLWAVVLVRQLLCVAFVVCVACGVSGTIIVLGSTVFVWLEVLMGQLLFVAFVFCVALRCLSGL